MNNDLFPSNQQETVLESIILHNILHGMQNID